MHGSLNLGIVMVPKIAKWGKHGGTVMRDGSLAFKQQQWGVGREHLGPHQGPRRSRFYMERMGDGVFVAGIKRRNQEGISPQKKFNKSHSNTLTGYRNPKLKRRA